MNGRTRKREKAVFPMTDTIHLLLMQAFHFWIKKDQNNIFLLMMSKAMKITRKCKLIILLLRLSHPKSPVVLPVICAQLLWGQKYHYYSVIYAPNKCTLLSNAVSNWIWQILLSLYHLRSKTIFSRLKILNNSIFVSSVRENCLMIYIILSDNQRLNK